MQDLKRLENAKVLNIFENMKKVNVNNKPCILID